MDFIERLKNFINPDWEYGYVEEEIDEDEEEEEEDGRDN